MGHSPGGPKKLTEQQEQEIAETVVHKKPVDVGIEARHTWTLGILVSWIEQRFQQSFTEKGVSKLLKRLGFSYTKATYTRAPKYFLSAASSVSVSAAALNNKS
ncbi:helix-turn-helix domain-containing protein [Cohnella fermenti]|nr:winged helix-turn-helix domain-containing protein [Cohnella fermenti]